MDIDEVIAARDRLQQADERKARLIRHLEHRVWDQAKTIKDMARRIRRLQGSGEPDQWRARNGQLYAVMAETLRRLVLDDVDSAAQLLVRTLRLTDEQLDDLAFKARVRQAWQRRTATRPNAIKGSSTGMRRAYLKPSKRRKIFERDGHRCLACATTGDERNPLTIDHVIPLSHGGTNEQRNLQTLCWTCNMRKNKSQDVTKLPIDLDKYEIRLVPRRLGSMSSPPRTIKDGNMKGAR